MPLEITTSELWFGNGFIHPISVGTTTSFHADVIEGDFQYRLPQGHLKAAGGWVSYGDNQFPHTRRDMYYYYLEATQKLHSAPLRGRTLEPDLCPRTARPSWPTAITTIMF